jgi:hypothetical protein
MKTKKTISPAYSVAGGDQVFEGLRFKGNNFLELQIIYTTLDEGDHKIRIQEGTNGQNYTDSKDNQGNFLEITLSTSVLNDIIKVDNFNADYIRARFIEGTTGTGTISTLNFLME